MSSAFYLSQIEFVNDLFISFFLYFFFPNHVMYPPSNEMTPCTHPWWEVTGTGIIAGDASPGLTLNTLPAENKPAPGVCWGDFVIFVSPIVWSGFAGY